MVKKVTWLNEKIQSKKNCSMDWNEWQQSLHSKFFCLSTLPSILFSSVTELVPFWPFIVHGKQSKQDRIFFRAFMILSFCSGPFPCHPWYVDGKSVCSSQWDKLLIHCGNDFLCKHRYLDDLQSLSYSIKSACNLGKSHCHCSYFTSLQILI